MLRLGIVDFDSSHCIEFTRRFNHVGVTREQFVDGARVVAGYPGTSRMFPERIEQYRPLVVGCGVELVERPEDLVGRVDGVLILSVCGTAHRQPAELILNAGVPVFIDKPLACSVEDAQAIATTAARRGMVAWSASGMRFSDEVLRLKERQREHGPILGLASHGPGWLHDGNPGLLHYGIHTVEQAYALLGAGCRTVNCISTTSGDTITAQWSDGRVLTVRTLRAGSTVYGLLTFHERGILHTPTSTRNSYRNLCREIVKSFASGVAPVPIDESVEVIRFITASARSAALGGQTVSLQPS